MQSMIESLTDLVRTIGSDGQLQQWFWSLGRKSLEERRNAVYLMSMRISTLGKSSASLVTAFKLLAVPQVFEAACDALRKCGYPEPV